MAKKLVILLNKNFFTITTSSVLKKYKFSKKNIFTPNITSKNYINVLAKIIKKESIDYFFPCIDAEIPLIAKNNKKLKCKVFVEKFKKVLNCHDKFLTFKYLKKKKINTPYTAVLNKYNIDDLLISLIPMMLFAYAYDLFDLVQFILLILITLLVFT